MGDSFVFVNSSPNAYAGTPHRIQQAFQFKHFNSSQPEGRSEPMSSNQSRTPPSSSNSSSTEVVVKPEFTFGPCRPLAQHLRRALVEWHKDHPTEVPTYASGRHNPKTKWKVFDRQGREVQLMRYSVTRPRYYCPLVLRTADGQEKFVSSVGSYSRFGIFLVGWSDVEKKFEKECCAIRCFGPTPEEIIYPKNAFLDAPVNPSPKRYRDSAGGAGQPKSASQSQPEKPRELPPRPREQPAKLPQPAPKREAEEHPRLIHATESQPVTIDSESEYATDGSSETDSSEEEESDGEDIPYDSLGPDRKRRRINQPPPTTRVSQQASTPSQDNTDQHTAQPAALLTPLPTTDRRVVFIIASDDSDVTRAAILRDTKPGSALFAKAREFYRLLYPGETVNVLSCKAPSSPGQRYLYEDDDEISYFIRGLLMLSSPEGGDVSVMVKRVR